MLELQVFKNLCITGDAENLRAFVEKLSSTLPAGWTRDLMREAEVNRNTIIPGRVYAFGWLGAAGMPAANLFLSQDNSKQEMQVSNIVPKEIGSLTMDEYNAILDNFADGCARPIAGASAVSIDVTADRVPLTHWVTEEAAKKFRAFVSNANRSMLHPFDEERWRSFVIQVHRDDSELHAEQLKRWLTEVEKWPEDGATRLAIEYEFARDLLNDYDKQ